LDTLEYCDDNGVSLFAIPALTPISEVGWCFVSAEKALCEAVTQMGFEALDLDPLKAGIGNQ